MKLYNIKSLQCIKHPFELPISEKEFTKNVSLSFGFERYDKFVLVELKVVLLKSNIKKVLTKIIQKFYSKLDGTFNVDFTIAVHININSYKHNNKYTCSNFKNCYNLKVITQYLSSGGLFVPMTKLNTKANQCTHQSYC